MPLQRHQQRGVDAVLGGVAGIQLNGALELRLGLGPVVKPDHQATQRIVRFGQAFAPGYGLSGSVQTLRFAFL